MVSKKNMSKESKEECQCNSGQKNPFVAVPVSLGGILIAIVALVLIFSPFNSTQIVSSVAWSFVVLGFFGMLFAYKSSKR